VLGGGRDVAQRRVHHDDPAPARGLDVDVVDADPRAADELELGSGVDDVLGDFDGAADDEAFVGGEGGLELVGFHLAAGVDFDAAGAEDAGALFGDIVGDEDAGHAISPRARGTRPTGCRRG
jgi:hypothetical protein